MHSNSAIAELAIVSIDAACERVLAEQPTTPAPFVPTSAFVRGLVEVDQLFRSRRANQERTGK
jgi:hypothetical protein